MVDIPVQRGCVINLECVVIVNVEHIITWNSWKI